MSLAAVTPQLFDTQTLLPRLERDACGNWTAECHDLTLSSSYQPIVSLDHRRIVGHEALVRAHDRRGQAVSPAALFARAQTIEQTIELDRLCRLLHGFNFSRQELRNEWLFLNVNPEVITHGYHYGSFFAQMLEDAAIAPAQVVIEVLEGQVTDAHHLTESVNYYRQEAGCLVLLEGIENLDETLLALDSGCDLVQGFFFSTPDRELKQQLPAPFFPQLDAARGAHQQQLSRLQHGALAPYHRLLEQASHDYQSGNDFFRSVEGLLQTGAVQRLYRLDDKGELIGDLLYPQQSLARLRPQMAPLHDASGANFGNRPYFQNAMENPEVTQTTRPALCPTGSGLCITLSRRIERNGASEVVCCDLSVMEQP